MGRHTAHSSTGCADSGDVCLPVGVLVWWSAVCLCGGGEQLCSRCFVYRLSWLVSVLCRAVLWFWRVRRLLGLHLACGVAQVLQQVQEQQVLCCCFCGGVFVCEAGHGESPPCSPQCLLFMCGGCCVRLSALCGEPLVCGGSSRLFPGSCCWLLACCRWYWPAAVEVTVQAEERPLTGSILTS